MQRCLDALAQAEDPASFEVILVDDASPEPLRGPWPDCLALRLLRQETRQGFLVSANRGAAAAAGKYLYFLNDDTQVRPGFLRHALALLRARPDAGFVASKLLYPDGRLQEAGSLLFADGSATNRGHGASPDDYRYNHVCRVDYGSGAGLLVRREVFEALGGFDSAFAPAYYEDVDLQWRGRARGWLTYFQPRSEVVHERGQSYGHRADSASARLQARNREVMKQRHGASLAARAENPHIYVFDTLFPRREHNAGAQRCYELLHQLAQRFTVTFVPLVETGSAEELAALTQAGIRVAQSRGATRPVPVEQFLRDTQAERVPWCIAARPDGAARVLQLLRIWRPSTRLVYDTVDLAFQRYRTHLERSTGNPADRALDEVLYRRFRALETHLLREADRVWVVTEEERQTLVDQALCPPGKLAVVPVVYAVSPTSADWAAREHLLFVGGFAHRPNLEAVEFAITEVLPLLVQRGFPGRFLVVGSEPGQIAHLHHDRVDVLGYQQDLQPLLNRARLAFFPLVSGAGMKGKVAQALAAGLPVVTTPHGAQGFGLTCDHLEVAADASALADRVMSVYQDATRWGRLREAGLHYATRHLSLQVLRDKVAEEFEENRP